MTVPFPGRAAWPFYIVCDVSQSMWDPEMNPTSPVLPHTVISRTLPDMLIQLEDDPFARDNAHLSVVAFGAEVQEVLPLTRLRDNVQTLPRLPMGETTDFRKIFEWLAAQIRSDLDKIRSDGYRPQNPTVFFITDGNPTRADWEEARDELSAADFDGSPLIVAFGLGEVRDEVITKVASRTPLGAACAAEDGAEPAELLEAIIGIIHFSISQSMARDSFVFRTPKGMRRLPL